MNRALHAPDADAVDPKRLAAVPPDEVARLVLRLHPSVSLLDSPWPVDRIWRANQPGAAPDAIVDLDAGGVHLEIRRLGDDVVFRRLDAATSAFRQALARGDDLERAAGAGQAADAGFDLTRVLRELFDDGIIVGASAPTLMEATHAN